MLKTVNEAIRKALAGNSIGPQQGQVGPEKPEPYHRFLYHLCRLMVPDRVLELGVKHGNGVNHMALGSPNTSVIGVDIAPQTDGSLPLPWNVTIVQEQSLTYLRSCKKPLFDVIHIDTEHYPALVNAEFNEAYRVLRTPGVICIDDIFITPEMRSWWAHLQQNKWLWPEAIFIGNEELHVTGYGIVLVSMWPEGEA